MFWIAMRILHTEEPQPWQPAPYQDPHVVADTSCRDASQPNERSRKTRRAPNRPTSATMATDDHANHSDHPIQLSTPTTPSFRPWFDQLNAFTRTVIPDLARHTGTTPLAPHNPSHSYGVIFRVHVSIVNIITVALNTTLPQLVTRTVELVLTTFLLLYLESLLLEDALLHYHAYRRQPATRVTKKARLQSIAVINTPTKKITQRPTIPCNNGSTIKRTGTPPAGGTPIPSRLNPEAQPFHPLPKLNPTPAVPAQPHPNPIQHQQSSTSWYNPLFNNGSTDKRNEMYLAGGTPIPCRLNPVAQPFHPLHKLNPTTAVAAQPAPIQLKTFIRALRGTTPCSATCDNQHPHTASTKTSIT